MEKKSVSGDIKSDFPIFKKAKITSKQFVYLDSTATSQKSTSVIKTMVDWYERYNANIHRGVYELSEQATQRYEAARQVIASFIKAPSHRQIIYTRGTTEGINLVAQSWGRKNLRKGDAILLTTMEHHANLVPWQQLALEKKLILKFIDFNKYGELELNDLEKKLQGVKLVSLVYVSNVLGTINPVKKIIKVAHTQGIPVLVDAAQAVPHLPVDVVALDCDWLAFSGHKMLGPTGIGILYAKTARLEEMDVYQTGGDMIKSVTLMSSTFAPYPVKFEAGTQAMAEVVGLAEAMNYLHAIGMEKIARHDQMIVTYAYQQMKKIKEVEIYGPSPIRRSGAIAFNVKGIHAHDLATFFAGQGVCIRAGHHCAQPLHDKLGIPASARVSFYIYNNKQDVDYFIKVLKDIIKEWQKVS
jgi:cysteine desulfurase/selenocysteine lyase